MKRALHLLTLTAVAALAVSCGRAEYDTSAGAPMEPATSSVTLEPSEEKAADEHRADEAPEPEPAYDEEIALEDGEEARGPREVVVGARAGLTEDLAQPAMDRPIDALSASKTRALRAPSLASRDAVLEGVAGAGGGSAAFGDGVSADQDDLFDNRRGGEARAPNAPPPPDEPEPSVAHERDKRDKKEDSTGEAEGRHARAQQGLATGAYRVMLDRLDRPDPLTYQRPERVLPRMFYFENTYLGGSAAYRERLLRLDEALSEGERPYRLAFGAPQPLDPPSRAGLEVTAELDAPYFDQPRRVFLQVGLKGSARHGWRRPPLDVMVVVDPAALPARGDAVSELVIELLQRLGPADRLGVVVGGAEPLVFTELSRLERARTRLASTIDELATTRPADAGHDGLAAGMRRAGELLAAAAEDTAIVPGTQTLMVVTAGDDARRITQATREAHALTVQGAVTSVFALDRSPERAGWWQVANAGHGNYHHLGDLETGELVAWELESLARVVARLVRVNVRLGKSAEAIRVLGTRVLDAREVAQVKAREVATDENLSRAMGITSDRGDDDDGVQTVIPYFYGDDSHVILIELWVEGPGAIADVTVRYKDMVNLDNATARTSVRLDSRPRAPSPERELVRANVAGFELAASLERASHRVRHADAAGAHDELASARAHAERTGERDLRVVRGFERLVGDGGWTYDGGARAVLSEALLLAAERKVGQPSPEGTR